MAIQMIHSQCGHYHSSGVDIYVGSGEELQIYDVQYEVADIDGVLTPLPGDLRVDISGYLTGTGDENNLAVWDADGNLKDIDGFGYESSTDSLSATGTTIYGDEGESHLSRGYLDIRRNSDTYNPFFTFWRKRQTGDAVKEDDLLGRVSAYGHDGLNWSSGSRARINLRASQDWDSDSHGTKIDIEITPTNSTTPQKVATIDGSGLKNEVSDLIRTQNYSIDAGSINSHLSATNNPHSTTLELARTANNTLGGAINFAGYKAIAMACDNGSTLPSSPTPGQWFLHTPTGRKWLMMYDGSAWRAMMGFGTTTLYVDGSSGTDGLNYGFGTGTNAFRTIQYALNNAPSKNFGGSIYIYPSSGTYAENLSISGIDVSGGNLVIAGSLATYSSGTITSGVQGSGSTQASITDSSASWTTNEHRGRFVVVGGDTLPITGNSATTLYCAGRFSSTPSGSYTIKYPGVVIKSITLDNRQVLQLQDMEVSGSTFNNLYLYSWSKLLMYRCKISATSGYYNASIQYSWLQSYYSAWIANNNASVVAQDWSKVYFSGCLVYQLVGTKSTGSGIFLQNSVMTNPDGLFVENFNKAVDAKNSSMAQMYSATIYNFIYNNNYGVYASNHSKVTWTSRCAFSGNTTDSYADSATYGLTSATG